VLISLLHQYLLTNLDLMAITQGLQTVLSKVAFLDCHCVIDVVKNLYPKSSQGNTGNQLFGNVNTILFSSDYGEINYAIGIPWGFGNNQKFL